MLDKMQTPSDGRLQAAPLRPNSAAMPLRLISAVLLALALLFSPVARMSGGGMALAAEASVPTEATDAHCAGSADYSGNEKPDPNISCASACAALHAILLAIAGRVEVGRERERGMMRTSLAGIFTEFETPPPRA